MQNILTLETNRYSIKLDNFEGPLDLLCHLIDKNKMDIYDINLSKITDQYVDYIRQMEQLNLEITSEFLVMSSTLLYLKSKHLLPKVREEEEELTEEELIRRIIEYKKYKEINKKLKENFLNLINALYICFTVSPTEYVSVIAIFSIFDAFSFVFSLFFLIIPL